MNRRNLLLLPSLVAAPLALRGNTAAGDPRLEGLFASFIAPCCWNGNLLTHQSPKADELRTEIRNAVLAGQTDEDIKRSLVAKYSLRILSLPEGVRLQWLSWMPVAGMFAGLAAIAVFMQRSLRVRRKDSQPAHEPLPSLPEFEDV